MDSQKRVNVAYIVSLVMLSIVVMLPRLFSPQFGLLDDGLTLQFTSRMSDNPTYFLIEAQTGRFRPSYWLFNWFQYLLFGQNPLGFFVINTVILSLIGVGIFYLIKRSGASLRQAWISGLLIVLADPVIENFYTLSKSEPIQLLILLIVLILAFQLQDESRKFKLWIVTFAEFLLIVIACGFKETTLILVPVSLAWLLIDMWLLHVRKYPVSTLPALHFMIICLTASVIYLALRNAMMTQAPTSGWYTQSYQLNIGVIIVTLIRWLEWIAKSFGYALPLVFVLMVIWKRGFPHEQRVLVAKAAVWCTGWIIVFLPWIYTSGYYLLPFALGLTVICAAVIEASLRYVSIHGWKGAKIACVGLGLTGILFLLSAGNYYTNIRQQLLVDQENDRLVAFLAKSVPEGGMVVLDYPENHEYIYQLDYLLAELWGREDVEVISLDQENSGGGGKVRGNHFLVRNVVENNVTLSIRLGIYAEEAQRRNTQSVGGKAVYQESSTTRNIYFDMSKGICMIMPGWVTCAGNPPLVNWERFSFGWMVYQITQ